MKNKKLKIAFFLDNFYPQINGVVTSSLNTIFELARKGHEVCAVAPSLSKKLEFPADYFPFSLDIHKGFPALIYPDFIFTSPFTKNFIKSMKKFNPDIIHFHAPLPVGYKALLCGKILKTPVVGTFHTFFAEPEYLSVIGMEKSRLLKSFCWWYSNRYFERCDAVVSPAQATAEILKQNSLSKKISVISNGVETKKFKNFKFNEKLFPLTVKKNEEWILYIGRISKEKSIDVLINAFYEVSKQRKNARFLIVGDGPFTDEMKKMVKEKNIEKKCFITGMIPNKNLLESGIIKKMKLFVTASTSENQPMTILESMIFGLPIIGPDAKGIPEMIEGNGFAVKPGSIEDLAEKIMILLKNKNLYKKFSLKSLQLSDKYDIAKTTSQMEKLYYSILKK